MAPVASYGTLLAPPGAAGRSGIPEHSARTKISALSHLSDTRHQISPDAIQTLNDLIRLLKKYKVEGPQLFRIKTEFNKSLGSGAQCSVWGIGDRQLKELLRLRDNYKGEAEKIDWPVDKVAIKRHIPAHSRDAVVENVSTRRPDTLGHHLWAAKQEIEALSYPPLRDHKNIVELLGWGFCLDVAETSQLQIPLLVLERADMNLFEISQKQKDFNLPREYRLDERDLCGLLRDVGKGLGALHDAGLSHGDLKPQNVLVFKSGNRKNVTWTAKLCDFGFARGDIKESADAVYKYYGTPGWIPPEAVIQDNFPLRTGALKKCDVYVYGLLVCSVFTRYGAPVQSLTASDSTIELKSALSDFNKHVFPCGWERYKLAATQTLKLSLQVSPQCRSATPWQAWEVSLDIDIPPFVYKYISRFMASLQTVPKSVYRRATAMKLRQARNSKSHPLHPPLQREDKQQEYPKFWEEFHGTRIDIVSENPLDGDKDPFALSTFAHGDRCVDVSKLRKKLNRLISRNREKDQIEIYSLARLRSRMRLCCWRQRSFATNILELALRASPSVAIPILAWLARGEIGLFEIKRLRPISDVWDHVLQPSSMDESQRLERFLLLLQFGAEVEKRIAHGHNRTIMVNFVLGFRSVIFSTVLTEILRRFRDASEFGTLSRTTTEYLKPISTDNTQTILDDFCQLAEEAGYEAAQKKFGSNQGSKKSDQNAGNGTPDPLGHKIMPHQLSWPPEEFHEAESNSAQSLPPGWEEIIVQDQETELEIGRWYREEITGSLTLLRPKFSLYVVRHLVVGIDGTKRSIYLSLDGFVNRNTVQQAQKDWSIILGQRFPFYDNHWFRMEAYEETPERDVLSNIKNNWQLPSLPSLLSFPGIIRGPSGGVSSFVRRLEPSEERIIMLIFGYGPVTLVMVGFLFACFTAQSHGENR